MQTTPLAFHIPKTRSSPPKGYMPRRAAGQGQLQTSKSTSRIPSLGKKSGRLTSLATLNNLNVFTRRSSSRVMTTTKNDSQDSIGKGKNNDTANKENQAHRTSAFTEDVPTIPTSQLKASRRTSWVPVAEEPSKPLPRSLTLGNLPCPPRGRPQERSRDVAEKQPDHSEQLNEQSRPSLRSRIPSGPKSILKPPRSIVMQRPDTEPLLPGLSGGNPSYNAAGSTLLQQVNHLEPSKLSTRLPIPGKSEVDKPLPAPPRYERGSFLARRPAIHQQPASFDDPHSSSEPLKPKLIDIRRRTLPRFHTQPNLSLTPRPPTKTEVKYHKLLTPKQAPTPVPRTPLLSSGPHSSDHRTPRPQALYDEDFAHFARPPRPSTPSRTATDSTLDRSPSYNPETVTTSEPLPYWCGRFLSLHDRARTHAFHNRCDADLSISETRTEKFVRCRAILGSLYAACEGEDALASLQVFHAYMRTFHVKLSVGEEEALGGELGWSEVREAGKEVRRGMMCGRMGSTMKEAMGETEQSVAGAAMLRGEGDGGSENTRLSAGRRATFVGRLLGRGRRTALEVR